MRRPAERPLAQAPVEDDLVTATGVYRVVMVLLAVWTFFAGLALITQGVDLLALGGDSTAERVIGAQLLMLVPVYALIVWHPDDYRYLRWLPYAAQLAIVVPIGWDILLDEHDFFDGALLLVVSVVFFALLIYVRSSSHPLGFFAPDEDEEEEEFVDEDEPLEHDEEDDDVEEAPSRRAGRQPQPQQKGRRYRRR